MISHLKSYELHRNWERRERKCEQNKIKHKTGGVKSTGVTDSIFLKRSLLHICAPPLPGWRCYDSYLKVHDCTSHARKMQYCSDSLPDGVLQRQGMKLSEQAEHKSGGVKSTYEPHQYLEKP